MARPLALWAGISGFILLFPVHALRSFYALDLPRSGLPVTVLIAALGAASIVAFWAILQRRNRTHPNAAGERGPGAPAADDEPPGDHASAAVIRSSSPARRVR